MSRGSRVSPEELDRISNSMGKMARDYLGPKRMDGFFESNSTTSDYDDLDDLREEDVWGDDSSSMGQRKDRHSVHMLMERKNSPGSGKTFNASRRSWLSVEMESALHRSEFNKASENGDNGNARRKEGLSMYIPQMKSNGAEYGNGWHHHHHHHHHHHRDGDYYNGVPQSAPVSVPVWGRGMGGGDEEYGDGGGEDDEDDDGETRLPPHEIVRQHARSQATTFSVVEGNGRTLKGMDLRRVRNAVWMQTGFID